MKSFYNFIIVMILLKLIISDDPIEKSKTVNSELVCDLTNCRLPLCKCSNTEIPGKLEFSETPMMIGLSFNGILTIDTMKYLKEILKPIYKNPNGCPVQATFFVSDKGNGTTDYCVVQSLFNNNNEIAIGSVKYDCPYTDCDSLGRYYRHWKEESAEKNIYEQKKKLARKSKINKSFLRGFRLPYVDQGTSKIAANAHFKALKKYAFNYDSSVIIKPNDIQRHGGYRLWPHTLDFAPNYTCPTCPVKDISCKFSNCSMNSVWIVPLHYFDSEGKNPCPSLIKDEISENRMETKNCIPRSKITQRVIEQQLFDNFLRHYETNKAPFIINIETSWFEKYGDIITRALKQFINDLTDINNKYSKKNDIYFVSISKIIEWVEYPTPISTIANKWLWDCDDLSFDYDEECQIIKHIRQNSEELEEIKKKNKTQKLELQAEILFHNGVLTGVIVLFILAILYTIIYDKYMK